MINVIGVRFRTAGKIYFFSPGQFAVKQGDHVIVETARGVEYGRVVSGPKEVSDDSVVQPLKSVIRIATDEDKRTVEENHQKEKEAFKICQEKIRKHNLDMKLIDAEYTFDNNKVLFYFTADGRIDFRELVKDLAAVFRTRIELMCCLTNDEETYEVLNSQLPSVGDMVTTSDGLTGVVQSLSVLRGLVKVVVNLEDDEKEIREYKATDLKFRPRRKKKNPKKDGDSKENGK